MIFSDRLLFIHVPKTGGMSIKNHLLRVLPPPVYSLQPEPDREVPPGVVQLPGKRHETLAEARAVVREHGRELGDFQAILAAIRNPFALEVSRYAYLRLGHPYDAGYEQTLALEEEFPAFAARSRYRGGFGTTVDGYFAIDGEMPPNLRVVRYERLGDDVAEVLRSVGVEADEELPWVNKTRHAPWETYYDDEAEAAVFERYRWVFEQGWYDRLRDAPQSSAAR